MTGKKFAMWATLSAALAVPLAASADDQKPKETPKTTLVPNKMAKLSDTELQILAHIHHSDEMEVKAGKLAMQKGSTQAVKSYGKMLVDDHGADAQAILALVKKQGVTLPEVKPVSDADKVDLQTATDAMAKLDTLSGKDFDREFLRTQLALHDKTLTKLDLDIAKIKDNPDLVQMLRGNRPVLVRHAEKARTLLGADADEAKP